MENFDRPVPAVMSRDNRVEAMMSTLPSLPPLPTESCIFKVPYTLRRVNQEAYAPWRLSIGPFHHGKENLREMEVHKQRYLNDFLGRRPDVKLGEYIKTLEELEDRVRNCYAENINCTSNDFIRMMLLDCCFIIELFMKFSPPRQISKDDPLFRSEMIRIELGRDILLLENQLPFFVFECLFNLNVEAQSQMEYSFHELTINFMTAYECHHEELNSLRNSNCQAKHFVDLYLQCYTPTASKSSPKPEGRFTPIPNATRLHDAGVEFKKSAKDEANCFLDVKFEDGTFEIPTLVMEDQTETLLRNLIAFEQCDSEGNTQYMSDYIYLMDSLIDTPADVALLREAGIIDNFLGGDEEVAEVVNKLGSGVRSNLDVYYGRLCEDLNEYYNKERDNEKDCFCSSLSFLVEFAQFIHDNCGCCCECCCECC